LAFGQTNPRVSFQDSYSVDGVCYCNSSNFDHNIGDVLVDTPVGEMRVIEVCADIRSVLGTGRSNGRIPYNDIQCGNGPANDAGDEDQDDCPGRVDIGREGCQQRGPLWDLESVYASSTGGNGNNSSGDFVSFRKSNNRGFAIDGNRGGSNGQNVYLWQFSATNVNQHWDEISRGGDFYSYQKRGTNVCLDGGNGGERGQNVNLVTCSSNNQNQQWRKVSVGDLFRIEKRNAPGFSLDGNNGAENRQNLYLWSSDDRNANQLWQMSNHD